MLFTVIAGLCATASTIGGGLLALRFKKHLRLILGFTAGVLIGVVALDVLPEVFASLQRTGLPTILPMGFFVIGFLVFHVIEKTLLIHHSADDKDTVRHHPDVGKASALALIGHSFLDGFGIGVAFHFSSWTGVIVAVAVIAHDFCDGINTVSLMLLNDNKDRTAKLYLALDALAPAAGALVASFLQMPDTVLLAYLGVFAGFLTYIGASEILPDAHAEKSSYSTILLTIIGAAFIFVVTRFI